MVLTGFSDTLSVAQSIGIVGMMENGATSSTAKGPDNYSSDVVLDLIFILSPSINSSNFSWSCTLISLKRL